MIQALRCARERAAVFLADGNGHAAEHTARPIHDDGGASAVGAGEVATDSIVNRVVAKCMTAFGRIDILHNILSRIDVGDVSESTPGLSDAGSPVNLQSVFPACRHTVPPMRARKAGAIVNIPSIAAARYPGDPQIPFPARRAGIVQPTRAIAVRNPAEGIPADIILPGFMDKPHVHAFPRDHPGGGDTESLIRKRGSRTPSAAWAPPGGDVARAAAFPVSDQAAGIIGTELIVDGGASATAVS